MGAPPGNRQVLCSLSLTVFSKFARLPDFVFELFVVYLQAVNICAPSHRELCVMDCFFDFLNNYDTIELEADEKPGYVRPGGNNEPLSGLHQQSWT